MKIALRLKLLYLQLLSFWKNLKLKRKENILLAEMREHKAVLMAKEGFLVYDAETIRKLPVDEKAKLGARFPGLLQHLALHERRIGMIILTKKS